MKLERIGARGCDGLYRDAITKIIYVRKFRKGKKELKRSTFTRDIEEAKKKRDQYYQNWKDIEASETAIAKQTKTALELMDIWIARKETLSRAPATIASMKRSRNAFKPYFETMMPDQVTPEWWETVFIPQVRGKGRKFFNDRKWLLGFLGQCRDEGIILKLPKLLNPDSRESVGKVYSDGEVMALLNHAAGDIHLGVLMAATMGMRFREIFALQCDRVDIERRLISLRRQDTKTRRMRTFAISPAAFPLISQRCNAGAIWIFPSRDDKSQPLHKDAATSAWRRLKKACGIKGRFHDLRHTFLTKAFNAAGANAAQICSYAGLSLQVAERVYLHLTEEDSRRVGELVTYE